MEQRAPLVRQYSLIEEAWALESDEPRLLSKSALSTSLSDFGHIIFLHWASVFSHRKSRWQYLPHWVAMRSELNSICHNSRVLLGTVEGTSKREFHCHCEGGWVQLWKFILKYREPWRGGQKIWILPHLESGWRSWDGGRSRILPEKSWGKMRIVSK